MAEKSSKTHEKDELLYLREKYLPLPENEILVFGQPGIEIEAKQLFTRELAEATSSGQDEPDGFYRADNRLRIFEHFEFDGYKRSRGKGSQFRQADSEFEKRITQQVDNTKQPVNLHGEISLPLTMQNYLLNAITQFENHAAHIPAYHKNLEKKLELKNETTQVTFLIEDTTCLGSVNAQTGEPILLPLCDKFLDVFEAHPEVDSIVSFSWCNKNYICYINRMSIEECRKNQIATDSVGLISWDTKMEAFDATYTK